LRFPDDFLTGGDIVSTRGRAADETQRYQANAGDIADGKPIIVLINEGTASASEIVCRCAPGQQAGDDSRHNVVRKGSVQTIIPLVGASVAR
jgi:carboxyl-terminal processing protease